jgi:hypothetical protein
MKWSLVCVTVLCEETSALLCAQLTLVLVSSCLASMLQDSDHQDGSAGVVLGCLVQRRLHCVWQPRPQPSAVAANR